MVFQNDWDKILNDEFDKEYYRKLMQFINKEYENKTIYPPKDDIFNAMKYTSYAETKVVILGQDPYHGEGQAHGLAFSVLPGVKTPPSLVNMFKELKRDLGCYIPDNGSLTKWSKQGVLLLNTVLTVEADMANSHKNSGWTKFTDKVIQELNDRRSPVVFMLWGRNASEKLKFISSPIHYVLETSHPSPLSSYNGFDGCGHFSKTNTILNRLGHKPIDWQIENI